MSIMILFLSLYPGRSFYGSPPISLTLNCGEMSSVLEAVFYVPGWWRARLISIAVWISLGSAGLGWVKGTSETWRGIIVAVCPYWDVPEFSGFSVFSMNLISTYG